MFPYKYSEMKKKSFKTIQRFKESFLKYKIEKNCLFIKDLILSYCPSSNTNFDFPSSFFSVQSHPVLNAAFLLNKEFKKILLHFSRNIESNDIASILSMIQKTFEETDIKTYFMLDVEKTTQKIIDKQKKIMNGNFSFCKINSCPSSLLM